MENATVVVQERSIIRTVGDPDDNKEKSKLEKLVGEVGWKTGREHEKKSWNTRCGESFVISSYLEDIGLSGTLNWSGLETYIWEGGEIGYIERFWQLKLEEDASWKVSLRVV